MPKREIYSFSHCSKYIAQFEEYKVALIDHLLTLKVNHWDKEIRELTSLALAELTPAKPEYVRSHVIPELIKLSTGFDLFTRHGAIISLAKVVHALSSMDEEICGKIGDILGKVLPVFCRLFLPVFMYINLWFRMLSGDRISTEIEGIPKFLKDRKMFHGMGGELMRLAVCTFIEMLSCSGFPIGADTRGWYLLCEN